MLKAFKTTLALFFLATLSGCASMSSMTEKDGPFAKDVTVTNYERIYVDKEISLEVKLETAQNNPGVLLLNKEVIYKNLVSELKEKGIIVTSDSPEQYFVIIDKYTSRGFEEQASTNFGGLTGSIGTDFIAGKLFDSLRTENTPWILGFRIEKDGHQHTRFTHHRVLGPFDPETTAEQVSDEWVPGIAASFFEPRKQSPK